MILNMQGDIIWYSDSTSDVALMVTHTVDSEEQFKYTITEFTDDPGSRTVSLKIRNTNSYIYCDNAAVGWKGNLMTTLGFVVLACLLITRWSTTSTCLVAIGCFVAAITLQACANSCTEKTDVAILVPR